MREKDFSLGGWGGSREFSRVLRNFFLELRDLGVERFSVVLSLFFVSAPHTSCMYYFLESCFIVSLFLRVVGSNSFPLLNCTPSV